MGILSCMSSGVLKIAKRVLGLLLLVAILVAGGLAFMHRQTISDHFAARSFTPSPEVAELVDSMALTEAGERVFMASKPTLDGSQHFNDQCAAVDHSEQGHVLGCFSGEKIHLFEVADERLQGVVEVTAAHELLHAIYQRMGAAERDAFSKRLNVAYEELAAESPELKERMAVYDHLSQASFSNELHSVLGTEVQELPQWLENHYAVWFEDRDLLLDHFESYHAVFTELRDRAEELQEQMLALRDDVEQRNAEYEAAVAQFNADADDFQKRNEAYEFSDDPDAFQRIYDELEARRQKLQADLAALQADIAHYEEMRKELQQLSQTSTELDQLMDSELAPPATRPDA